MKLDLVYRGKDRAEVKKQFQEKTDPNIALQAQPSAGPAK